MTRRGIILFASLGIIWGIPYLFIKIAVAELSPEFLALARTTIAAALLLPLAARHRAILPALRRWKPLLAFALFEIVMAWFFLNTAQQTLPSSTVGLLLAAIPLVSMLIAFVGGRRDRLTGINLVGVALGMIGVGAIVGFDVGGSDLEAVAQLVVTMFGYALGPAILARYLHDLPGVGVIACALGISAVAYVPIVALSGTWPTEVPSPVTIISVLVLAVLCSAVAFLLMFALVAEVGPIRMSAITYVNPAVAVLAGAVFLGEELSVWTGVGFVAILAGSALVTRPDPAKRVMEAEPEHPTLDEALDEPLPPTEPIVR
ncbi:DMT family transporter [Microcella sp.]|uniref:DMT family transporter n=1 Tax=Microcella sp. TaxID=1913979 RepID=UPI00391C9E24